MSISERIDEVLKEKGITRYKLSKDTGVPYSTLTQILNNRTKNPQVGALQKIADYLDKPLGFFTEEKGEYFDLTEKDNQDIATELERMMSHLDSESSISYHGEPLEMDENDRELLRISFENSLRVAKQIAKKKFTPKKYRN